MVNVKTNSTDIGLKANPEDFSKLLKPVQGKPLHFTIERNKDFEI